MKKVGKVVLKTLKVLAWVVASLVVLLALALWAVVWLISPENLTKYAEQAANKYLNAQVEIGRLELTAYSTFPILHVDIDSLAVLSNSLVGDTAAVPADAAHLVSFSKLHLGINLPEALVGRFDVKDLSVTDLNVNIVETSSTHTNYAILPEMSQPDSVAADTTATFELPWIRCKQIILKGDTRLAYYSAAGATSASVAVDTASVVLIDRDKYRLALAGVADCSMGGEQVLTAFPFKVDADVAWDYRKMMNVGIEGLQARFLDIPVSGHMALYAEDDDAELHDFALKVDSVRFTSVLPQLPATYRQMFSRVRSNVMVSVDVQLNKPYILTSGNVPSLSARLVVPDSYWRAMKGSIDHIALDAQIELDDVSPNASSITLNRLILNGMAVELQLEGSATNLFKDPHILATVKGHTDLGMISELANVPLDFTIAGEAEANASVDMHMSYLNQESFHKMKLSGGLELRNVVYDNVIDTMSVRAGYASLTFGNKQTYMKRDSTEGNDLLRVSAYVDTLDANIPGIDFYLANVNFGGGVVGAWRAGVDSTQVIPMGFKLSAERVRMKQQDGTFFLSRGLTCNGSVSRFMKRLPIYYIGLGLDTLFYRDNSQFVYLKDSKIDLVANRRVNRRRISRVRSLVDTLRVQHPEWSNDTLLAVVRQTQEQERALARKRRSNRPQNTYADDEVMDMSVDSGFARLLSRWQVHGRIQGNTGAMYTPYFPLRNRITDVDMKFNADSVVVNNFNYTVGNSNFNVKGRVRNIRSSLMGRTHRPLDIAMIVKADSININQLVKAAADGLTYSTNVTGLNSVDSTIVDISQMQEQIEAEQTDTTVMTAFLVPRNIEASIALRSNNIEFADMNFKRFDGNLFVHDGVLNLNELRAVSDMGSARFNAMYASADRKNIKFGMDLELKKIDVGRFIKMIPAIDSVMPLLQSVDGIIDADIATTANVDSLMNIDIPSLRAAVKLHGDSLVFMDAETFKRIAKMLLFKNRERNMIDEMTVELLVENSQMMLFPFMFNVDRYKLGVLGYNDLDLNFRYHVSVLKSPIPFKFGINIYGNPDDMHFRLGRAKYKEEDLRAEMVQIVDTTRINLREQISSALRRGADAALKSDLYVNGRRPDMRRMVDDAENENLTHADSLQMMQDGYIERPDTTTTGITPVEVTPEGTEEPEQQQGEADGGNGETACRNAIKPEAIRPETWLYYQS